MRRLPTQDIIRGCLVAALIVSIAMLLSALAGAAESQAATTVPLYQFFDTPAGKIAFLPGEQPETYRVILAERFWNMTPIGQPAPPTPVVLTGLAKDTRDWATQLVPAEGRAAEARRLASGYRAVAERATKGEFTKLQEVQAAQATENRKALGIPLEDAEAGKASRWYPVIVKLAQWLQTHPPTDPKAMGPISLDIAQGLEAVE